MVRLQILSGTRAGVVFDSSKMPVAVGRSDDSDLALDDPGVWPSHCKIHWRKEGIVFEVEPSALASINHTPVESALLRSGDLITLGAVHLRFSFSPVRQPGSALKEWLTWIALTALCLGQIAVIYKLNG